MATLRRMLVSAVSPGSFCALLLLAGMSVGGAAAAQEAKGITVRVLLFSGRPDPVYELADDQLVEKVKANIARAKVLEAFDKKSVIPVNIGYKGILVSNPQKKAGLPARFAVYKGAMEVEATDGQKRFLADEGGAIEKLLMDEAIRRGLIDEVILKRMKKEP